MNGKFARDVSAHPPNQPVVFFSSTPFTFESSCALCVRKDLRESERTQQAALEKLRSVKEEKRRELMRRKQQEEERRKREEERKRQEEEERRRKEEEEARYFGLSDECVFQFRTWLKTLLTCSITD